ncbi:MAG: type IV secretory system conjugative DNA transfer family protein [Paracoccus sp.]|nr:type IV secretory system conjugative DNA transfer family protein [Paracoccus sp. (in: a-proteobacteria)]
MSWVGRLFRFFAELAAMAIAVPWLLFQLAVLLLLASGAAIVAFMLVRGLILGEAVVTDPTSVAGRLGFLVVQLAFWALAVRFWAYLHGFDHLFARRGNSHGSARFSSKAERAAFRRGDGLLIGRDPETGRLLRYDGPAHLLTLAPTRAGKGVGTIIPNLLTANRPVLVIDPKGENARIAAKARERFGPVHVLDPFGVTGMPSAACNPMAGLDPGDPDLGDEAATLSEALVMDPPGQVHDAHWNEEAKSLLAGLILFCACHEPPERRTLASVRDYLSLPPGKWAALLELMQESDAAGGLIARAANRFAGKAGREAASVMSNAQRHTRFLDSPRIVAALSRSDVDFADLRRSVTSIFLVLPPNRLDAYSRWLRLMVSQALQDIARAAERPGEAHSAADAPTGALNGPGSATEALEVPEAAREAGEPPERRRDAARAVPAPALFLLDEFAALGRLEAVERGMGLMAGYGIQLWPILQDLSQLRDLYGARAGTFLANAAVQQVFGVNDLDTAKWLSESIGRETAYGHSESHQPGEPASLTTAPLARDLLTPDEIMQMPAHLQLLRVQGQPVMLAEKLRYYADPEFRDLFTPQPA